MTQRLHRWTALRASAAVILIVGAVTLALAQEKKSNYRTSPTGYTDTPMLPGQKWRVHDIARPKPPLVTPGAAYGQPPSDAVVLFDGKNLSQWVGRQGGKTVAPGWKVENGYMEVVHGVGEIASKEKFGDCQIHVEFASPTVIDGDSQWRGNSGVLLMSVLKP